jgi:hypothetical protein
MFVIDWILAKFNYHKFYKVDVDALFAEFDKQDPNPATPKKRPARKAAAKKPAAKKVATARKKA